MASTSAERKAKEAKAKADSGLVRRAFWLDKDSIEAFDKFKADGDFKTNDEAIAAIIKLAIG